MSIVKRIEDASFTFACVAKQVPDVLYVGDRESVQLYAAHGSMSRTEYMGMQIVRVQLPEWLQVAKVI